MRNKLLFKPLLLLILMFGICLTNPAESQIRVFEGKGHYFTELVLIMQNNRIFEPVFNTSNPQFLYTVQDNQIMQGGSGSMFDLLFTVKEDKLWRGDGFYTSDIAYTFKEGKIFKGDSNFMMDQVYTVKDNVIYLGHTTFATDALYLIEGNYNLPELFAILLSLNLIVG